MSVRSRFLRLEAQATWRTSPDAAGQSVIAHLGATSLTLIGTDNSAIVHWSLSAVHRVGEGSGAALFTPDPTGGESLEVTDQTMIDALTEVLRSPQAPPQPRRHRTFAITALLALSVSVGGAISYSSEFARQLSGLVGRDARERIGLSISEEFFALYGRPCDAADGVAALQRLRIRVAGRSLPTVAIVRDGVPTSFLLPGGRLLLASDLVVKEDMPEIAAGHIVRDAVSMRYVDPLGQFFAHIGVAATLAIMLNPASESAAYRRYARAISDLVPEHPPIEAQLAGFAAAGFPSSPFAQSLTTRPEDAAALAALDPQAGRTYTPLLYDSEWLQLRDICGN